MESLSAEQKELLLRDSNGDGIPDIIDNPESILDKVTLPTGKPLLPIQKKMIAMMISKMNKTKATNFIRQVAEHGFTGTPAAGAVPSFTQKATDIPRPTTPTHSTMTPRDPFKQEQQKEFLRKTLIIGIVLLGIIIYFAFGR